MVQNKVRYGVDTFQSILTQRYAAKGFMRQLTAHCCQKRRLTPFCVPPQMHIPVPYMSPALAAKLIPHIGPVRKLM